LKKLLVVWPVHRKDWVSVFPSLVQDFSMTFLGSISPTSENHVQDFAKSVCWNDYSSTQEIFYKEAPELILFMSVDSGLSMLLNQEAKKREITTFILQHGIYTNYKDYRSREKQWKNNKAPSQVQLTKDQRQFSTLAFAQRSLNGIDKIWILLIFIYQIMARIKGGYWAAKHLPLGIKRVDRYLCFSPFNAIIHKETDRVKDTSISYIGSIELEKYLKSEAPLSRNPYYLHIDQALAENSFGEETVSKKSMIDFYLKLNEFCLSKSTQLLIKLHPESYLAEWLPENENIIYVKQIENLNQLIQSAKGCFGFYSTLIIPAVYWRPTVLFKVQYSGLQSKLREICGAQILPFKVFNPQEIQFQSVRNQAEISSVFINSSNRTSLERLKEALNYG